MCQGGSLYNVPFYIFNVQFPKGNADLITTMGTEGSIDRHGLVTRNCGYMATRMSTDGAICVYPFYPRSFAVKWNIHF
jgi:hypothetical protein